MITVDIKSLLKRLNPFCKKCLESAANITVSRTHYEITVEHLFQQILEEPRSDSALILRYFSVNIQELKGAINKILEDFDTGNGARPTFSPRVIEWFQEAQLKTTVQLNQSEIRSGALLLAFLSRPLSFSAGGIIELLEGINLEELTNLFGNIVKNSIEQAPETDSDSDNVPEPAGRDTALNKFCEDFTQKASQGKIDPVFGRDKEIRQMIDIFARRRKNNPIIVGEAGVGKTAVVEGLALRIVNKDVPDFLKDVTLMSLDMGLLKAGAGMKGEFENRLKKVINEVKSSEKPIILFIDEAHTMIGAGGSAGGGDAANLLKPALARGELRTVAATTWSEYKKYFEKDAALARRFQPVQLDEPSEETATLILRGLKEKYEQTHQVIIRDDAIVAASEFSNRYISGRYLPDKAIDLIDTSAARVKVMLTGKPDVVEGVQRNLNALKREQAALKRDMLHGKEIEEPRLQDIDNQIKKLEKRLEGLTDKWKKEQKIVLKIIELRKELEKNPDAVNRIKHFSAKLEDIQQDEPLVRVEVDPEIVSKVVSDWTGIPVGKVMSDEAENVIRLESDLKLRIKGQEGAIKNITEIIKASKAQLTDPCQPIGVFLLVGPSGVGKTETGLAIAELLFGGERFVVSVNMSEFQEKHTVSRLIGSPPGYVGYGEGGVLTEAVRQRPYSVVLLDEAEKANFQVMNLFYQVFDKGSLSDGEGRDIDFKNTVIFLTSNLASDIITDLCSNGEKPSGKTILSAIRPVLSSHFKPALLARMKIVPYLNLDSEIMEEIVRLKLDKLSNRLMAVHKIAFTYSDLVTAQIAGRCLEVETGARNIDYIMKGKILPKISREILGLMSKGETPSKAILDVGEDGTFKIDFSREVRKL